MSHIGIGRSTNDLIRIAAAGAGFHLKPVGRSTEDLIRIASAAKSGGCVVTILGTVGRSTEDLIRIGNAGEGHVVFGTTLAEG